MNDLALQLEAILYHHGGTVTVKELAKAANVSVEDVRVGLDELRSALEGRGVALVQNDDEYALATSPAAAATIERVRREELEGPIGKAGMETLAVVLYRAPVSRADIEYVRGVNATTTLRTLLIRGLIERTDGPDARAHYYRGTAEALAHLGVSKIEELAQFDEFKAQIDAVFAERIVE